MLVSPLFQFDNAKVQKIQMQNNTFPQLFSINFNFRSTFGRLARPRTFGGFCACLTPRFQRAAVPHCRAITRVMGA
jgi:hypothetical protein